VAEKEGRQTCEGLVTKWTDCGGKTWERLFMKLTTRKTECAFVTSICRAMKVCVIFRYL